MLRNSFAKGSDAGLAMAAAGLLLSQAGVLWGQAQKPSSLPALTSAEQVRVLSPDDANRGYPVHIRAVVTYCDPSQQDFFVQDATAGIYVDDPGLKKAFAPGELLEIEGVSEDLDFAPQIGKPTYRSLGHAPLPQPQPASFDALISTREDSQFVQFDGIVQSVTPQADRILLDVVGGGGHLSAIVLNPQGVTPAQLVDAKVRLRGVSGGIYNQKHQLTGVQLEVASPAQLSVLEPAADPFRLPLRPLNNLMVFTPQGDTEHRIRVEGTVTLLRPKGVFIQEGKQGLFLPGTPPATLTPGQRVEAVGFADIGDYSPVLQHAIIRPIGSAPVPDAVSARAKDVLANALDATRVSLQATLRDKRRSETDQQLVLDDGGVLFEARIDQGKVKKGWPGVPPGSRVRVTGVCSVTVDRDRVPTSFTVLLDSPQDLTVLARPSWWTLRSTLFSLAILGMVTLAVLAWVGVLSRQVRLARERAQVLFSANPHPAYVFDVETLEFLEVNDAAVEHYGYSREEFLGMQAAVLQPDEDEDTVRERLRRMYSAKGISIHRRHRTKDGHLIDVEVSSQTITFKGRKATLTIAQDITDRTRAEAENLRLAAAIQQSAEAIVITDAAGTIQFVNPAFSQITGYSAGEVLGQNPRFLKSGKQDAALYEDLWATILGGRTWRGEVVNRRKNGTFYSEEMTITPVRDAAGNITNFVAIKQDLTHHKRAAEALTASEKRYRMLFERNAAGIFATTLDGRILNCNQAAAEMFGYPSPSEVPHLRVVELYSSASDREPVLEKLRLEKSLTNYELKLIRSDGTPVWAIANLNLVEGGNGQPGIVETILVDITERKRAEEALRQNEESFHLLFSDNPLPMWVYDVRSLRFLEVNTAAVAHYGYSRDEFLGMRIADIRPEEDLPLHEHSLQREQRELEESGPSRHRLRDGRVIDVQIISHTMMWNGVGAVLVVAQDVTDRKRAEEALRQSEARFRLLFERNLAGVFQAEADGRLADCNDAWAHMLGYASRDEMLNIRVGDLILDPEAAKTAASRLAEQNALTSFEVALKGRNGEPVWVVANVTQVDNGAVHYEGTVIDVTARKRAEEALRSRTVELERSNADLEQFAYVASHDLQEPLRMVANFTELLRERYQGRLDQDADEFIGFAVEGAVRMQDLINGLLSYARVKSRAREMESADSEAVLDRCLTTLRGAIRESDAQVTHDPLPPVFADELQLEQVLQNLVSNAVKFRGSDPPRVHISAERNGAQWVFTVKDNGIGIDPRFHERIFIIFQRLHTRQAYPGTGIGLSICKRIVERHGGRIWLESEDGKGTTFYFTMPAVPEGSARSSTEVLQLTA